MPSKKAVVWVVEFRVPHIWKNTGTWEKSVDCDRSWSTRSAALEYLVGIKRKEELKNYRVSRYVRSEK